MTNNMKPAWLNKKINLRNCSEMKVKLRNLNVETVCEQAICPNMEECFNQGQATFLILGCICTRCCSFCNLEKSTPLPLDLNEPDRIANAVSQLGLKHVVITSVTRDDLEDGGAMIFAQTIRLIRERSPKVRIETLIPDFKFSADALKMVLETAPDILAHNLETVPSLYKQVRHGADYIGSLNLLRLARKISPQAKIKSGLMLGLGESQEEIFGVMHDLRLVGCDYLTVGQYLSPSKNHHPVIDYIPLEEFDRYKEKGRELGFLHIESGPYVRSSYMAGQY
ncbi:MAG: lipoyl synthase [Candidatus Omnitrophota bacterium]